MGGREASRCPVFRLLWFRSLFPRRGSWCLDHRRYYAQPLFRFPRARCALSLVPWSAFGSAKTIGLATATAAFMIKRVQLDFPLAPILDTDSEGRRQSRPSFRQLALRLGIGKQPG